LYVEDLKRGSNKDIGPKDIFEMGSKKAYAGIMIPKRYIWYFVFALMVGIVSLLAMVIRSDHPGAVRRQIEETPRPADLMPSQTTQVHLYFSDKDNQFLMAEERVLKSPQSPEFFARSIVEALIKGPQQGLARTIPAETAVRAVYLTPQGICYVDLTSGVSENHPGGIKSELLSIYSIVNSLVLNVTEIESVKILINGNESMTLAGHIDLQLPIKANMLLIR
jgi:spore germination protein GerM